MTKNVLELRKQGRIRQQDIALKLGIPRTTYAYKEETGSFTDEEKRAIAKILKVDMTTITWKPQFTTGITVVDERDLRIKEQAQTIIKLEEKVKTLQEMIDKLLQVR